LKSAPREGDFGLWCFPAIPISKLGRRQKGQNFNAKTQSRKGFLENFPITLIGLSAGFARISQKTWRLGDFALSSLVSNLELLLWQIDNGF
jgi:hypothetical protein